MPIYAAYGSNMHPEQMLTRAPHSPMAGTGWIEGWRLTFAGEDIGWEGALATIVEDPGSRVFVVLYDVPAEDEHRLDRWEGSELHIHRKLRIRVTPQAPHGPQVPSYPALPREDAMPVDPLTDPLLAWLYVVDAFEGGLPSAHYLGVMADAAEIAGAPAEYVRALRTRESRNVGPGNGD